MTKILRVAGTAYVAARAFDRGWQLADSGHPLGRYVRRVGHVVLNRPLIYGVKFRGTIQVEPSTQNLLVESCRVSG